MKKIVALLALCVSFVFASINLQTASKDELMSIKGIGEKKADKILEYRKTNKINSPEDLKNIKGFGDNIVSNVKNDTKVSKDKAIKDVKNKKDKKIDKESKKIDKENKKVQDKVNKNTKELNDLKNLKN